MEAVGNLVAVGFVIVEPCKQSMTQLLYYASNCSLDLFTDGDDFAFGSQQVEVLYDGRDITSDIHQLAGSIPALNQPITQTMVNQWFAFGQNAAKMYKDLWIIGSFQAIDDQQNWYPDCSFFGNYRLSKQVSQ